MASTCRRLLRRTWSNSESSSRRFGFRTAAPSPGGGRVGGGARGSSTGCTPTVRPRIPVPLAIGRHGKVRPHRSVCVSHERLETDEVVTKSEMRITSRERATFDEMRRTGDVREAVQTMDMMAAAEQTSIVRMRRYAERHRGWSRIGLVRDALDLASEHSRSPNETRLRLIWCSTVSWLDRWSTARSWTATDACWASSICSMRGRTRSRVRRRGPSRRDPAQQGRGQGGAPATSGTRGRPGHGS